MILPLQIQVLMKFAPRNSAAMGLLLITLAAFLIRLPYWDVIPASFDEVNQTVYAFLIAQGRSLPLVGNDAYAGPFYFYLLAGLLRLGITDPMIGRAVVLAAGTLTAPATYGWVYALSQNKVAGLVAALLVASNPDLILVNSHIGGTTFLLPFLTTLFLLALTLAVRRDSYFWLAATGITAGLALQSNPVAILVIAGGLLWLLWQSYGQQALGRWWPCWPACTGLLILLVYSPVIVYNLTTDFRSVDVLQERSYLWQSEPTVGTTLNNLRRLSLQTTRQVSGVLGGEETFSTLIGMPLLYLCLMIAGMVYGVPRLSLLPLFAILPFLLLFPLASSHYGFLSIGRFTTLLIPVWMALIGFLLAALAAKARESHEKWRLALTALTASFILLLFIYPATSLFQYYRSMSEAPVSEAALLEISRHLVAQSQDEPVYISTIEELSYLAGIPYVPHAAFILGDVYHEFLPAQQIIGRLYERPGPAYFLLSDRDAGVLQEIAPLERVAMAANEEARARHYGLYKLEASAILAKPDFVTEPSALPANLTPPMRLGEGIQLEGCDLEQLELAANRMLLDCYWQAIEPMPAGIYVGFAHLVHLESATLLAQDDHILGQERYPVNAWQPGEIIRDRYVLDVPENLAAGEYELVLGIYIWPEQVRLHVPGSAHDVVILTGPGWP
jgi:4-amino-4-deoxy-L-arabinose transferase-like glycosyltransferase